MLKEVKKVWGSEHWFVNDEYCGKILRLDRNAECSYHCHPIKKETFLCIEGVAELIVEGKSYTLTPFTSAITIRQGEKHKFRGITQAIILEVSTHHEDSDSVRFSESKPGYYQEAVYKPQEVNG